MGRDRQEFACQTLNISASGVAIHSSINSTTGERIVAYFERIGRIEGRVVRNFGAGFAMEFSTPSLKYERLNRRLASLTSRPKHESERRNNERVTYDQWRTTVVDSDGREHAAEIVDFSPGGAAVKMDFVAPADSEVTLSQRRARVVRRTADGVAVEFLD